MLQTVHLGPSENVVATASRAASSPAPDNITIVRVVAIDGAVRIRIGGNDAGPTSTYMAPGMPEYFSISPGERVSVQRVGAADVNVDVTFCTR